MAKRKPKPVVHYAKFGRSFHVPVCDKRTRQFTKNYGTHLTTWLVELVDCDKCLKEINGDRVQVDREMVHRVVVP